MTGPSIDRGGPPQTHRSVLTSSLLHSLPPASFLAMGNILGPERHAVHHQAALAPHPEHDSRDTYRTGEEPYLAEQVERGRGMEAVEREMPERTNGDPGIMEAAAMPPTEMGAGRRVPYEQPQQTRAAPMVQQPTPQLAPAGPAALSSANEASRRAEEAIARFKEVQEMQQTSSSYLASLENRIKDLKGSSSSALRLLAPTSLTPIFILGVQSRIDSEIQRSSSTQQTIYYAPENREPYREPLLDRYREPLFQAPSYDDRTQEKYKEKTRRSPSLTSTTTSTNESSSSDDEEELERMRKSKRGGGFHEVFLRTGSPQYVQEERKRGG